MKMPHLELLPNSVINKMICESLGLTYDEFLLMNFCGDFNHSMPLMSKLGIRFTPQPNNTYTFTKYCKEFNVEVTGKINVLSRLAALIILMTLKKREEFGLSNSFTGVN